MGKYATHILVVAILATLLFLVPSRVSESTAEPETHQNTPTEHEEPETVPDTKIELLAALKPICACESTGRKDGTPTQFNPDGSVVRGKVNPHDIGMCQVNTDYHGEAAEAMGLDLFTEAGNIAYANWLYTQQGSQPWNWSRSCWQ